MTTPTDTTADEYIELDSAPWSGYDNRVESHGEPWDTFIATLDADSGGSCVRCDAGIGSNLHDEWTDEGHRWGCTWKYMALILVDGVVQTICEPCATVVLPPFEDDTACDICNLAPCDCDGIYDRWKERGL